MFDYNIYISCQQIGLRYTQLPTKYGYVRFCADLDTSRVDGNRVLIDGQGIDIASHEEREDRAPENGSDLHFMKVVLDLGGL